MLHLENISMKKGGFSLSNLSFHVKNGEVLTILGPTGCGKTLLLESIAGVNRVFGGTIILGGEDITYSPIGKRDIGIVYQKLYLFPNMNVRRNIMFPLKQMKIGRDERARMFRDIVDLMGIGGLLGRSVSNLSGGERQRVALARTMVMNRNILLLDEPFSALDSVTKWDLLKQLKEIFKENGMTIVNVTHDIEEALFLSDHLGIMAGGKLIQFGETHDVYENPANEQCARLVNKENMFVMKYHAGDARLYDGNISFYREGLEHRSEYLVHVPPEDIIVTRDSIRTSARNVFNAMITDIINTSYGVSMNLNVNNVNIKAFITNRSMKELRFKTGENVYIVFKSNSVEVTG